MRAPTPLWSERALIAGSALVVGLMLGALFSVAGLFILPLLGVLLAALYGVLLFCEWLGWLGGDPGDDR